MFLYNYLTNTHIKILKWPSVSLKFTNRKRFDSRIEGFLKNKNWESYIYFEWINIIKSNLLWYIEEGIQLFDGIHWVLDR